MPGAGGQNMFDAIYRNFRYDTQHYLGDALADVCDVFGVLPSILLVCVCRSTERAAQVWCSVIFPCFCICSDFVSFLFFVVVIFFRFLLVPFSISCFFHFLPLHFFFSCFCFVVFQFRPVFFCCCNFLPFFVVLFLPFLFVFPVRNWREWRRR